MIKKKTTYLVTGCAGFIGFHVCKILLEKNYKVLGIDNINNYYEKYLKISRLRILKKKKLILNFIKLIFVTLKRWNKY